MYQYDLFTLLSHIFSTKHRGNPTANHALDASEFDKYLFRFDNENSASMDYQQVDVNTRILLQVHICIPDNYNVVTKHIFLSYGTLLFVSRVNDSVASINGNVLNIAVVNWC